MILKVKKYSLVDLIPILFVIMMLFSRGMILGNIALKVSFFAGVLCLICTICYRPIISNRKITILVVCSAFFLYCFFQGIILNDVGRYHTIVEDAIYWFINTITAAFVLSHSKFEKSIGKLLVIILSLFVVSYFITALISMFLPLETLRILTIEYDYFYDAPVYFPFTIAYGAGKLGPFEIIRMLGFGRECGISQTLYIWAFYKCDDYIENSKLARLIMGMGILFCFSTTGLVIFAFSFIIQLLMNNRKDKKKMTKYVLLLVIVLAVLFGSGTYSIANRVGNSYSDRMENILLGLEYLEKYPLFGYGFVKPVGGNMDYDLSDICFLSSLGKIGVIGAGLFFLIYYVSYVSISDKKKFILSNIGLLMTTLLAQPLYLVPLIYVMLFFDYSKEKIQPVIEC